MSINPNAVSTGSASRGAAPAIGPVEPPSTQVETVVHTYKVATPADGMDQTPASSSSTESKAPAPKAPDPKPAASDTQAAVDQANKEAIAELKKHNAFELMKMVRSGDIPAAILDNPVAMNLMLGRVQEFSRMIQMMTNMMQVEHDTLTAIIRNIKA